MKKFILFPFSLTSRTAVVWGLASLVFWMAGCAPKRMPPPRHPPSSSGNGDTAIGYTERGLASWYGLKWQGRATANGESFDTYAMTAAHKTLPFNSRVRVQNLDNGRETVVRINDRGPFVKGRIIDLTRAAAKEVDMLVSGVARVKITVIGRDSKSSPQASNASEFYTLQVGSFGQKDNAERLRLRLDKVFHDVHVEAFEGFFRVRVGRFSSETEADASRLKLQALGYGEVFLTRE